MASKKRKATEIFLENNSIQSEQSAFDKLIKVFHKKPQIKKKVEDDTIGTNLRFLSNDTSQKCVKEEIIESYPTGVSDPFVPGWLSFKSNSIFVEDLDNDTTSEHFDQRIVSINFAKKEKDVWFQTFYKPRTEEEMKESVDDFFKFKRDAKFSSMTGYESLGQNVAKNFDDEIEGYTHSLENDLRLRWKESNESKVTFKTSFEESFFTLINDYRDVYYPYRSPQNESTLIDLYTLHVCNHLLKSKRYEWSNDDKVRANPEYNVQDKGHHPQRILILVPFRRNCLQIVNKMMAILPKLRTVRRQEAFDLTFTDGAIDLATKPLWYKQIFDGSIDDEFCLGLSLHQGQLEIMSKLFSSDIIIATPLGIQQENSKGKMSRMLSNIELLIIDQADTIQMQNLEFLIESLEVINNPVESEDVPARLRSMNQFGFNKFYRQSIILSRYMTPDINSLKNYCFNMRGFVKVRNTYRGLDISGGGIKQVFEKFKVTDLEQVEDQRFKTFINDVFPRLEKSPDGIFLIVCASYLDFIRLRNHFDEEKEDYLGISDYTEDLKKELKRFEKREIKYLIYSERHFYFHGPSPKTFPNINQIVFYSLPENAFTYTSFLIKCNQVKKEYPKTNILSLFCKFDMLKLERIVGSEKSIEMIESKDLKFQF
jgi:U3 small nucleolar RNA-associated protein 25